MTTRAVPPSPAFSLRLRLLAWLLGAVVLGALVQAALAYRTALAEADEIFDYHMQQTALALRAGLPATLARPPLVSEAQAENFEFVVQIWSSDGVRIFESAERAALPQRAVLGFSEVVAHGSRYRVYSLATRTQVVQVAQDLQVRHQMARTLALRTVLPTLLMAPLLALVVGWVVSRSLAPVARVSAQLARRAGDDLDTVDESQLPDEVRPLVHELNGLFGRVRAVLQAQQHFVADAAHELRSPLAALKLQAEVLRRARDDAAQERALERLDAGIDRATRLIEQLMVLARQQAQAARGEPAQTLDLAALAHEALAEATPALSAAGLTAAYDGPADGARIHGHAEALRIALRNLLDNAAKYTPRGGQVVLRLQREPLGGSEGSQATGAAAWLLSVEDSGPGIDEAQRERVLDRFYRVPGTEAPGSGLGLSIVAAIAELHAARLTLGRSEALGGLAVRLRLVAV